MTVASL